MFMPKRRPVAPKNCGVAGNLLGNEDHVLHFMLLAKSDLPMMAKLS
jgi:hypothetical protein